MRRENRILPPGDIPHCMVALSKDEAPSAACFNTASTPARGSSPQFRQSFLAALTHVTRRFPEAIRGQQQSDSPFAPHLSIRPFRTFISLPPSKRPHCSRETRITRQPRRADQENQTFLEPSGPARSEPIEAPSRPPDPSSAPGSLYTRHFSPKPPDPGNRQRHRPSPELPRVYVANLMTQPGKPPCDALADHLRAISSTSRIAVIDWWSPIDEPVSPDVARRYPRQGAEPVTIDLLGSYKSLVRSCSTISSREACVHHAHTGRASALLWKNSSAPRFRGASEGPVRDRTPGLSPAHSVMNIKRKELQNRFRKRMILQEMLFW